MNSPSRREMVDERNDYYSQSDDLYHQYKTPDHNGREWSEGEYSDSNSNKSTKKVEYVSQRNSDDYNLNRIPREDKFECRSDRERPGHHSRDSHRERKRHHREKKKKEKRRNRHSSSSSSSESRTRSRRHKCRRRHRSRTRSRSHSYSSREGYSDTDVGRNGERLSSSSRNQAPSSTVLVRGLANHLTENDIREDIAKCGISAKDIRLIRYRDTGTSRGFAFVEFHNVNEAVQYMELRKGVILFHEKYEANIIYSVERNNTERFSHQLTDWFCTKCSAHNFKRREVCYRCHSLKSEDGTTELSEDVSKTATSTILLKNLDTLTTEDNVSQAFELRPDLGSIAIKTVKISRESMTNLSRGVCFVETNTVSDAVRLYECLTEIPLEVDERILTAAYCKPPVQPVPLNSAAAAALAAAQWSVSSSNSSSVSDSEIQRLAEYSAALYAKNAEEKSSYLVYYLDYYRNQHNKEGKLVAGSANEMPATVQSGTLPSATVEGKSGQKNRAASPDMTRLIFDNVSSFYYDPVTLLYYDGSTQYFYDSQQMEYLYWDKHKREYVGVSNKVTNPQTQKSQDKKIKSKEVKIKVSKTVLKDTLKQATNFNDKKNVKYTSVVRSCNSPNTSEAPSTSSRSSMSYEEHRSLISSPPVRRGISLVETYEEVSDSEEDSSTKLLDDFMDLEKLACTLCKRQFSSSSILIKHTQLSSLHKSNLVIHRKSTAVSVSSSMPYRDRAKERRTHFGPEATEAKNSLKEVYMQEKTGNEQFAFEEPTKHGIKEDNIGNKILQKMGWLDGEGLGKNKSGRTDIITTQLRADKAGLGASSSSSVVPASADRYTKARQLTLARYREIDEMS